MVWAGRYPGLAFVRCGTEEQLCKARPDKSLYGEKRIMGWLSLVGLCGTLIL